MPNTYSILIPAYNEGEYIERLLNRLCSSVPDSVIEIIVCDSISTDNTSLIVKKWERHSPLVRLVSAKKGGKPAAWNLLVQESRASVLVFFDADILPDENCLNRLIMAIERSNHLAYAGRRRYCHQYPTLGDKILSYIHDPVLELCLVGSCYAFRKELFLERMGLLGFIELPDVFAEDVCIQAFLNKGELCLLQDCIVNISEFSLRSYFKTLARKRIIRHEMLIHYPQFGRRLRDDFPESIFVFSQLKFVVLGNFTLISKLHWIAAGVLKWILSWCVRVRINRLASQYKTIYAFAGGGYLLRHDASTRCERI